MGRIFSFSLVTIRFSPFGLVLVSLPLETLSFQSDRERPQDRNRRNEKHIKYILLSYKLILTRLKVDLWRNGCELCRRTYSVQLRIPEWRQLLLEVWAQQFWVTTACVARNYKTFYIQGHICSGNVQEVVLRKKKQLFRPQDPGVDRRIILKCIFRKWGMDAWTGFIWLRI